MKVFSLKPLSICDTNSYIVASAQNNAVLIDAPADADYILEQLELFGLTLKKIFLTHGHIYGVKRDISLLRQAAVSKGADIAVYGHTHVAVIDDGEDCLVINPGSVSHPRDGKAQSFMVLNIEGDRVKVEHFHL